MNDILDESVTGAQDCPMRSSTAAALVPQPAAGPALSLAPAPAGGLLALGLAGFCAFLNVYAAQPILPLLAAAFGASKAAVGLTVSAPNIAVALAAPFIGFLAARFPAHRVIAGSLLAMVVPTLLAATAGGLPALVAWRFAQGLAVPGVYAVGIAYATRRWPGRSVGRAMAALVTGNVLGGFVGRAVSGIAAERWGWPSAFVALGALTLVGALATRRLLPPADARPAVAGARPGLRALAPRLRSGRLLATFAVGFSVLFGQVATFTYVTYRLAGAPFRLGPSAVSGVFAVYLVGAVATPLAGPWIGRLGSRRVVALATGAGLVGSALVLAPALWAVVLGLAVICSAVFVSQSASTSYLQVAADPELRPLASGLYLSAYYVGGAVGGVLPAAAWAVGGWTACVALVAAVQLCTGALALRFWGGASGRGGVTQEGFRHQAAGLEDRQATGVRLRG